MANGTCSQSLSAEQQRGAPCYQASALVWECWQRSLYGRWPGPAGPEAASSEHPAFRWSAGTHLRTNYPNEMALLPGILQPLLSARAA